MAVNQLLASTLVTIGAVVLGGAIGLVFGSIQNAAILRSKKVHQQQGWAVIPGSATRVAFLLLALVVVQIACPLFFEKDWMRWLVSAGVVMGYGRTLFDQFRLRSMHRV